MAFPSIISTFTNPNPGDKLNNPSHSSIESAQNNELIQIEKVVGTDSSILGTIIGDLRNPNSPGGGHVQTANKGGTGQTSYTKGDLLVATSSSVIAKFAVGVDGTVPTADSTAQAGISWQGVANATNIQNETYVYARASVMSASVYGINLAQPVSILSDGLGVVVKFPTTSTVTPIALSINATGPSSVTALIKTTDLANVVVGAIQSSMIGVLKFDSVSSVFQLLPSLPTATKYANGIETFSSTSIIGVNPGFQAKNVRIHALNNVSTAGYKLTWSNGGYSSTSNTNNCLYAKYDGNGGVVSGNTNASAWVISGSGATPGTHTGTITGITTTNFNLNNVKSSTVDDVYIFWEAQG